MTIKKKIFRFCVFAISLISSAAALVGCGAEMTVVNEQPSPPAVERRSAAVLSGATYATGGAYKATLSIGAPIPQPEQKSGDGRYKVK